MYEHVSCPKCGRDFGQEVKLYAHLKSEHDVVDLESLYVEIKCDGVSPTCQCSPDCREKIPWKGWKKGFVSKYARGHNARVDSVYLDPNRQREFAEKRTTGYKDGKYSVWNKGLTSETDERIARQASSSSSTLKGLYSSGSIVVDPKRIEESSRKSSETKRRKFLSGEIVSWNKGLTKDTSESLLSVSKKISERFAQREAGSRLSREELFERIGKFSDKFTLVSSLDDYERRRVHRLKFKCVSCGQEQEKSLAMLEEAPVCFFCFPKESTAQIEVFEFVKFLCPDAILSDREMISPNELDVYVPSKRVGIEYNGLYWHSSAVIKDPKYHIRKFEKCRQANVSLFSIYEDEWRDKRDIIESMLTHRLGMSCERIGARELEIVEVSPLVAKEFFDSSHLEGHAKSTKTFGLIVPSTGKLVAATSLRTAFHKRYRDYYEVARSCCAQGYSVSGWLGKLTKKCLEWSKSQGRVGLVTYVDGRVGLGDSYSRAGWEQVSGDTGCRFWWTDFERRYNRFSVRADKTKGLTQAQAASVAGVVPIYGSPNSLWRIQ